MIHRHSFSFFISISSRSVRRPSRPVAEEPPLLFHIHSVHHTTTTIPMNYILVALLSVFLIGSTSAFTPTSVPNNVIRHSNIETHHNNIIDTISSVYNNWGKKATASHILFRPSQFPEDEARVKLLEIKEEVGNDPDKFAAAAKEWSGCPSAKNGGDLGEFGPGMMVKNFDAVCFNEAVGVVHGPVSTQFGEHLILVTKRTGEN